MTYLVQTRLSKSGKIRRKPEKVIIDQQHTMPVDVLTRYQDVTLESAHHVCQQADFSHSTSCHIIFETIEVIKDQ